MLDKLTETFCISLDVGTEVLEGVYACYASKSVTSLDKLTLLQFYTQLLNGNKSLIIRYRFTTIETGLVTSKVWGTITWTEVFVGGPSQGPRFLLDDQGLLKG